MTNPGPGLGLGARWIPILSACALASAPAAQEFSAASDDTRRHSSWEFTLEPYAWIAGLEGSASADGSDSDDLGPDLGEAFGDLEMAAPIAFEARAPQDSFALLTDVIYLRLATDEGVSTKTEGLLLELAGAVPVGRSEVAEWLFGLRWIDVDFEVTGVESAEESWLDPFVGARGEFELGGAWSLRLRGDVGGFGVGSDLSWQGIALAGASVGEAWRLDFGYRALGVDFDGGDLRYDAIVHGPIVGLAFTP